MTITYPDGTVRQAVLLAHDDHEIRAIAEGGDDVIIFQKIQGIWISEEIEPVTIQFEWQKKRATTVPREEDCICPKELATRLIDMLQRGDEEDEEFPAAVTNSVPLKPSDLGDLPANLIRRCLLATAPTVVD